MQAETGLETSKISNGVLEDHIPLPYSHFDETQTDARSQATSERIAHYQLLLDQEIYQAMQRKASSAVAAEAYFEQASQIHTIGHTEVGIYAPFVLARSCPANHL